METELVSKWDNKTIVSTETELISDDHQNDHNKATIVMDHIVVPHPIPIASSTTAIINPLKSTFCYDTSTIVNVPSFSNDHPKPFSRRNTVQPLLKKPISNAPTTSIKPLILPAPTSDSFSQHTKSNLINMHTTYPSSSISTPYNCSSPMTMGIATIQPQHFSYQNLANNRYPMIPMSIQNNYQTPQLTLTNSGLGTTVQLMPVMNQNNNQLNNSRLQPVPLFMTPFLGQHSQMLFQPNMTLVPQNSNAIQTFNIGNTSYSHDLNPCQSILSQTINPTTVRPNVVLPTDIESYLKPDCDPLNVSVNSTAKDNSSTSLNPEITASKSTTDASLTTRPKVKQRGLIRTQIYRMKPMSDEESNHKEANEESPAPTENTEVCENQMQNSGPNLDDEINKENEEVTDSVPKRVQEPDSELVSAAATEDDPVPISSSHSAQSSPSDKCTQDSRPISSKRKLPSPEILNTAPPSKLPRMSDSREDSESGRKSPGSLFEKISQVIPERKSEILQSNKSNKLTAVVRPEQRKILMHYFDDLIIFESDEPFPTTNKMEVVKSAIRAGNIKLNPQKSKLLNDQFVFIGNEEVASQSKHRPSNTLSPLIKSSSFLEPLTIDIPTSTNSSCDSLDSSQVRPLSVCSHQSTLPATLLSRKASLEHIFPTIETPTVKQRHSSSKRPLSVKETETLRPVQERVISKEPEVVTVPPKEPPPVKVVSPVKPGKSGLDQPICVWSVGDVVDFVKQTPGCENYAALFQNHEIDGEALLLLSKDNLIQGALNMKIGPALKICARIEKRRALDPQ